MSKTLVKRQVESKTRNLLDMVPIRNPEYPFMMDASASQERVAGGDASNSPARLYRKPTLIAIAVPRFKGKLGRGFTKAFGFKPNINVYLDTFGSFVFRRLDGNKTVREIGEEVKVEFGEKVEPLYGRLAHFLNILEKNKLIFFLPVEHDRGFRRTYRSHHTSKSKS
jgi:hypothetical protein